MKDDYKRRRKAEREYIRRIPEIDPGVKIVPIHQKCMDVSCKYLMNVNAEGNEFIATSTNEIGLQMYEADDGLCESMHEDAISELSKFSDERLIPNRRIQPFWDSDMFVTFLAKNVVVGVELGASMISTWYVCKGHEIENIENHTSRGTQFNRFMSKLNEEEFIICSIDSNLITFKHENGKNLRETQTVWKPHMKSVTSISVHNDIIVTTSEDWTAKIWNVRTRERVHTLYHDQEVNNATISNKYVVTSSRYGRYYWGNGEIRIYNNTKNYSLFRILRDKEQIGHALIVNDSKIVFRLTNHRNGSFQRHHILIFDIDSESVLAQVKVGCRIIFGYTVLSDGRLVAVGSTGCRGVIATLPRRVRKLITPNSTVRNAVNVERRRRLCTLM